MRKCLPLAALLLCGAVTTALAQQTYPTRPVRVPPIGCGCDETSCEYSRIRDGFEIGCVDAEAIYKDAPLLNSSACEKLQHGKVIQCTPCLTTPWVVLAKIKIYDVDGTTLNKTPVTYDDSRRILLSTAVMQGHILSTCAL